MCVHVCVSLSVRMYVCLGVRMCVRADLSIPYWVGNREELLWCVGSIGGKEEKIRLTNVGNQMRLDRVVVESKF